MSSFPCGGTPEPAFDRHAFRPWAFGPVELPPRPERLPRGPRRIRDGLWSEARYSFDNSGQEITAKTHADGHSIVWPSLRPDSAVLVDPAGHVVDNPSAWREAHAFAFHWGAP